MTVTATEPTTFYRNVRTGSIVKVLAHNDARASISTFKNGKTGATRSIPIDALHSDAVDSSGKTHTSGYIPVVSDSRKVVSALESVKGTSEVLDYLDAMDDDELAELAATHEKIKKESEEIAKRAKAILKARSGSALGMEIRGNYALIYKSGKKFDAKTALRNLSKDDFRRILLPKPDSTQAHKVFEYEPEKLEACLKDDGPSLTIREATEEDRIKLATENIEAEGGMDIEEFVL